MSIDVTLNHVKRKHTKVIERAVGRSIARTPEGIHFMRCYCCDLELKIARKVKLRPFVDMPDGPNTGPDSAAYKSYIENMTYRWAFICNECYRTLDNHEGRARVAGKFYNIAGASRCDKAAVVNQAKYEKFQRAEASKLGLAY